MQGTPASTDAQLPPLPLPLLLLDVARDPRTGSVEGRSRLSLAVRAACLVELGDAGLLVAAGRTLHAVPEALPARAGTTVAAVARDVAAEPDDRPARHWVSRQALRTFDAAADELVARGDWRRARGGLLARSSPRYTGQENRTRALRDLLREVLTADGAAPGPRTRDLALLLEACRALPGVLPAADRRRGERRAREWADVDGGSRPVAREAVAAVRSSSAAFLAAVAS